MVDFNNNNILGTSGGYRSKIKESIWMSSSSLSPQLAGGSLLSDAHIDYSLFIDTFETASSSY